MKCGYSAKNEGLMIQIVCNDNKNWFRRESLGGGFGEWLSIKPPTIINDCLSVEGKQLMLTRLRVEPFSVPQR
jgi:hypothetical protein